MSTIYAGNVVGSAYAAGNTTQGSSQTLNLSSLVFQGAGGVSIGQSNGSVVISGATGGGGGGGAALQGSGTYTQNTGTVQFANSNGVTFGLTAGSMTASVATNYQTTTPTLNQVRSPTADATWAMGTNQVQFQFSNVGTFSTNANRQGLFEIDCQGNLTDGADVMHIHQSDNDPTVDMLHIQANGTNVTGLRLQMSASIAAEINKPIKFTHTAASAIGSVPFILGTGMSNSVANLNANYLEGKRSSEFQSTGAYLTTAAQSGHTHGSGPSITGSIGVTSASNAWSISIPAFLTTAGATNAITTAAQSDHSHGAVGFTGAGVSGSFTSASNGLSMSLSAAAGGGGTTNQTGPNIAVPGTTITSGDVVFSNANGVSFGLNGSTMTASVNAGGGGNATMSRYWHPVGGISSITSNNWTSLNSNMVLGHVLLKEDISFSKIGAVLQFSAGTATNSSGSLAMSLDIGIFQKTTSAGQWSLMSSASNTYSASWTSNSTSGVAGGPREFYVLTNGTLPPGEYVVAQIVRAAGTGLASASCTVTHYGVPMMSAVPAADGFMVATAATANPFFPLQGVYSAATAAIPNSIHASQVTQTGTGLLRGNFWKEFVA